MHAYRGIFGSHVANVFRRLERIVAPSTAASSATCSAARRSATRASWREALIGRDGRGRRRRRRAARREALRVLEPAVSSTTRASSAARRTARAARCSPGCSSAARRRSRSPSRASPPSWSIATRASGSSASSPGLARAHQALSRRLPSRGAARDRARAVLGRAARRRSARTRSSSASTSAGSTRSILIGAPPTLASAWQQAGRAGRKGAPALAVLVAYNETVDQYLMRHPGYFFGRSPEAAVIDPHNPYILAQQLACAAYELPLGAERRSRPSGRRRRRSSRRSRNRARRARSTALVLGAAPTSPRRKVNLRTISDNTYTIMDGPRGTTR